MRVFYRRALPKDALSCVGIIQQWNDEHAWLSELDGTASMERFWRRLFATELAWVAVGKRKAQGFCLRNIGEENNIGALYVARRYRNLGVGKALLDLAKKDCDHITVWAYEKNVAARRFYIREGLVEMSREIDEPTGLVDVEHRWQRCSPGDNDKTS